MAGPYPQYSDPAPSQRTYTEYPSHPLPAQPLPAQPLQHPRRRRRRLLAVVLLILAVVGATTAAIVYAVRGDSGAPDAAGAFTPATATAAIQNYLDALSTGDTDTVARNTLCGMYDAVRDQRADQALAKLASDAFRKQFSQAQVTNIDKMVFWSPNQAQVLFTLRVVPVLRGTRNTEEQAIAQLLYQDNRVFVCQYLMRSAGQY